MDRLQNGVETSDLLRSQAHIWNHIFNFINSMALKCAVQLQIPDIINNHERPVSLSELVKELQINEAKTHFVHRLMSILVHSGFFVKQTVSDKEDEKEECYSLTPSSRLLLKDEPLSITPFLLSMLDPVLIEPWQHMNKWFLNDDLNSFLTAHGMSMWDFSVSEPRFNFLFSQAMASDARLVSKILVQDFSGVFEGLTSLVDVGGGIGTGIEAIAKAFPHLRCINFDLPHVVAGAEESKKITQIGGDMFKEIPSADAIMLKWVMHGWTDEECAKILKMCKEAIPSKKNGGKVIIIDMVVDEKKTSENSYETQLFFDMAMMVNVKGKERTEKEWAKLFSDVGFSDYKIMPVLGLRSLIEVYP